MDTVILSTHCMHAFHPQVPVSVPGVPSDILQPWSAWTDRAAYESMLAKLAGDFQAHVQIMEADGHRYVSADTVKRIMAGGPNVRGEAKASN